MYNNYDTQCVMVRFVPLYLGPLYYRLIPRSKGGGLVFAGLAQLAEQRTCNA